MSEQESSYVEVGSSLVRDIIAPIGGRLHLLRCLINDATDVMETMVEVDPSSKIPFSLSNPVFVSTLGYIVSSEMPYSLFLRSYFMRENGILNTGQKPLFAEIREWRCQEDICIGVLSEELAEKYAEISTTKKLVTVESYYTGQDVRPEEVFL